MRDQEESPMTTVPISKARERLAEIANRVAFGGERVVVERRGKHLFALVSIEDMHLLEELEDRHWAEEGKKALEEFDRSGRKSIPLEQVKRDLGP
jgi:prevent-host-death family protein